MFETLEKIRLNIDKTTWETVKFGDVAREVRESVKDPAADGLERIVGLEHIEPENIHLKAWGSFNDGTTFTRRFRKGQVLFGRRRAYLKKAALAEFDGLCSGDIIVLEAKDGLLPELLPFIVQNDRFFEFAVKNSAGSLSPRTKFNDLARFEFRLPPKDRQAQIAELLWAADEVVNHRMRFLTAIKRFYKKLRDESVILNLDHGNNKVYNPKLKAEVSLKVKFRKLGSTLLDIKYGSSKKSNNLSSGYPILRIPNVVEEKITLDDVVYVEMDKTEFHSNKLSVGDIVIVRTNGNPGYVGRSAIFTLSDDWTFASYLIKISINKNEYLPDYVVRYLQSTIIRNYFHRNATSTAGNYNINTQIIKSVPIPILSLEIQRELVNKMKTIEDNLKLIENQLTIDQELKKSLVNQVF